MHRKSYSKKISLKRRGTIIYISSNIWRMGLRLTSIDKEFNRLQILKPRLLYYCSLLYNIYYATFQNVPQMLHFITSNFLPRAKTYNQTRLVVINFIMHRMAQIWASYINNWNRNRLFCHHMKVNSQLQGGVKVVKYKETIRITGCCNSSETIRITEWNAEKQPELQSETQGNNQDDKVLQQ